MLSALPSPNVSNKVPRTEFLRSVFNMDHWRSQLTTRSLARNNQTSMKNCSTTRREMCLRFSLSSSRRSTNHQRKTTAPRRNRRSKSHPPSTPPIWTSRTSVTNLMHHRSHATPSSRIPSPQSMIASVNHNDNVIIIIEEASLVTVTKIWSSIKAQSVSSQWALNRLTIINSTHDLAPKR